MLINREDLEEIQLFVNFFKLDKSINDDDIDHSFRLIEAVFVKGKRIDVRTEKGERMAKNLTIYSLDRKTPFPIVALDVLRWWKSGELRAGVQKNHLNLLKIMCHLIRLTKSVKTKTLEFRMSERIDTDGTIAYVIGATGQGKDIFIETDFKIKVGADLLDLLERFPAN